MVYLILKNMKILIIVLVSTLAQLILYNYYESQMIESINLAVAIQDNHRTSHSLMLPDFNQALPAR